MKHDSPRLELYPGRLVLISILSMIGLGTILLSLPIAQVHTLSFIDVLFTAASATSITGILTVPIDSFTMFGKAIILLLMQIGGLGLVTLTIFSISLFVELGLGAQLVAGELLEMESWYQIKRRLLFIILLTLIMELVGATFFYFEFSRHYQGFEAVFISIFHAVSSFCNVGLTLFDKSLISYKTHILFLFFTAFLVFSGGFGFLTWYELFGALKDKWRKKRVSLSLTTKIALWANFILLITSGTLLFALERNISFYGMPLHITFGNVIVDAIFYRSTGFTTIEINQIHYATLFVIMIFAFIGSTAGSTGSGVKQSTFAIFYATVKAAILGKSNVHILGRRVPRDQMFKAVAIISLSVGWVIAATLVLLLIESGYEFIDIFFEVVSSFANLGLSTGITQHLTLWGKSLVIVSMIVGRIGSLTLILALMRKRPKREFEYPEERIALS